MSALRQTASVLLLVLAAVVGASWLPGTWLQDHVVDRDGFLEIAEPMGEDASTQHALTDAAVDELLSSDVIPSSVRGAVAPYAKEQAASFTTTSAYQEMWDDSMGSVHDGLFASGDTPIEVDLSPAVDSLMDPIEEKLPFGITLPRPDHPTATLTTIPDLPALRAAAQVLPHASWALPVMIVLMVLALIVADRRRAALLGAGIATLVAGAIGLLLAAGIGALVPASIDGAGFLGPIVQGFEARLSADIAPRATVMTGVGAGIIVVGAVLLAVVRRPVRRR
ncbi:hypothetical protein Bra3105_15550 [Brachybacterium halotolerans subsp. kimchii]|uniref:hypothetical protein n=1 Tax=Brachybacterium halotolerans TaxID=2795215 RepID=UPI001E5E6DA1|nr:hypothetical protein [Brachybacterium halotolerans]UEJ82237.1 hypothetical protein Bra3105_15550 [Brachybacterium halotolerans subsp. kimchii]